MNKFRIVEVDNGRRTYWNVQEKGWIFWWNIKHYVSSSAFGTGWWTSEFNTFGEAQSFIERLILHRKNKDDPPIEKVVKTYEY
jgi:hypothetical protein